MLINKLANFYKSYFKLILILVFLALVLLAWSNRFIQDDAFISLRYADNLAHGKGLVWNDGERVEGYTNFLWTIILSIPLYLNLDPVKFSFVFGLCLFVLSLYLTWRLAGILLHSRHLALLVVVFLGTNHSFSSYATGGMETQLQTCLFLACLFVFFDSIIKKEWSAASLCLLSVLLSLALLTRLDSALLLVVILPRTLFQIWQRKDNPAQKSLLVVYLLGPLIVLVGAWLIWKMRLYGSLLPNTFYVKVASLNSLKRGVIYVGLFLYSYWLVPFPFLFLVFRKRLFLERNRVRLLLSIVIILWLIYVVAVGGDFMEFRFIVPVLPLIFIQIVGLIFLDVRGIKLQIVLVLLVLAGSLHHALTFTNPPLRRYDIESTKGLSDLLTQDRTDWIGIGKVLGDSFDHDANVTIATTAAGAIPYYSHLKSIDILGLNDQWVARHGEIVASKPGHQRRATINYLIERKVNLLIGHPQMAPIDSAALQSWHDYYFYVRLTRQDNLPPHSKIIEIPINSKYKLRVLYLVENPLVEATIKRKGWVTYPLVRDRE
jgi:arabinofuranosyltransferase